jgi:hypothetical protein
MNERLIKLPKRFIEDHESRGLIELNTVVVSETKTHYLVRLSTEQAKELHSDADFYSDRYMAREFIESMGIGFVSSARATKKILENNNERGQQ